MLKICINLEVELIGSIIDNSKSIIINIEIFIIVLGNIFIVSL